jgi:hypothetical protein
MIVPGLRGGVEDPLPRVHGPCASMLEGPGRSMRRNRTTERGRLFDVGRRHETRTPDHDRAGALPGGHDPRRARACLRARSIAAHRPPDGGAGGTSSRLPPGRKDGVARRHGEEVPRGSRPERGVEVRGDRRASPPADEGPRTKDCEGERRQERRSRGGRVSLPCEATDRAGLVTGKFEVHR